MLLVSVCASTWNLSGILDHVVESWAHLRPSFPRLPYDLVGVVAERYPDALLVGSVVCDNAYALELLHLAGGFLREPVSRCGTSVSVSDIAIVAYQNPRLIRPFPQCHLPKLKHISAEALP